MLTGSVGDNIAIFINAALEVKIISGKVDWAGKISRHEINFMPVTFVVVAIGIYRPPTIKFRQIYFCFGI